MRENFFALLATTSPDAEHKQVFREIFSKKNPLKVGHKKNNP